MKKLLKFIFPLVFMSFFALIISSASGISPIVTIPSVLVLSHLSSQFSMPIGALFSALDITALVADLGAYNREHRDTLISEMLLNENFADKFEIMDDVTDELPLPNLSITDIIKPADPLNFTPTANALAFGARTLKVRGIKVDLLLIPQVLEKTWLGKLKSAKDPLDLPFEAFIMNYIMEKCRENLLLQGLYNGVYNAGGTTPVDTMDGYLQLIADEITATNIAPIVTGAITATNVIDSLETVYDALGEAYKKTGCEIKVGTQIFDFYNRRYRALYGANTNYDGMKKGRIPLDGTDCDIVREPGLGSSQRTICSQKENFVMGVDTISGYNLDVQKFDRSIKVLIDFKAGVEFKEIHARSLAVNDQA